jgi:hypothetical protein
MNYGLYKKMEIFVCTITRQAIGRRGKADDVEG